MKKSYFIYAPIVILFWVGAILVAKGNLLVFWDLPSLALIVFPPLCLLLAIFGPRGIVDAFKISMNSVPATKRELEKGRIFFVVAQRIFLLDGAIGTLTGFLLILTHMTKSDMTNMVGCYAAVAFLTVYYSLLIVLVVTMPFKAALESKLVDVA